jgi:hypothetical protein
MNDNIITNRKTDKSGTIISKMSSRFSLLQVGDDRYKINILPVYNPSTSDIRKADNNSSHHSRPSNISESEDSLTTEEEIIESLKGNQCF